ncbi:MAG: phage minor capsid protein [Proteobacteria bacterium]|jgi:hypothetical protein|nr:phage minor capsid protein [Pseudomonadota bacterium]
MAFSDDPSQDENPDIARLIAIYGSAYISLLKILQVQNLYGKTQAEKNILKATAFGILDGLDKKTSSWIEVNMPKMFRRGVSAMNSDMVKFGIQPMGVQLSPVQLKAIKAMSDDLYTSFGNSLLTVRKDITNTFSLVERQELVDRIQSGVLSGSSRKKVVDGLNEILKNQGVSSLIDKGGKRWQLDTYAEMLVRTKMNEVERLAGQYALLERGHDLVQISAHLSSCESCRIVEGKVYSMTGATAGYPTFDQIKGMSRHIFGPNCRHRTVAYHPEFDDKSSQTKKYSVRSKEIPESYLKSSGFAK